jgi:hypothetical protein
VRAEQRASSELTQQSQILEHKSKAKQQTASDHTIETIFKNESYFRHYNDEQLIGARDKAN